MNKEQILELLQEEYNRILGELTSVARNVDGDWVANMPEHDDSEEDDTIEADRMESFDNITAKVKVLEEQIHDIEDAIKKLEDGTYGTYGTCEVCGDEIEQARIERNPQARTCTLHM